MSFDPSDVRQMRQALVTSLRQNWKMFLIEGIVLVVLGAATRKREELSVGRPRDGSRVISAWHVARLAGRDVDHLRFGIGR